jgi:hypothetical protein
MTSQVTYTKEAFLSSPRFMEIAVEDALKVVAKTNGQSLELAKKAFVMQVPNLLNKVAELVIMAAEHCADEANKNNLWRG